MRRVTFSRNVTLSLSRTCRCHCKYCAFATHKPHLHEPEEVERLIDRAARRGVKELLVLTGEAPAVQDRLDELGFEDFVAYVVWACERGLERGLLPHTNLGVLERAELARLREVTASQGLMLESTNPDLVAHQGSPTKHPAIRLEMIRAAGELKIPFTSGILVGIGESEEDRVESLEALAGLRPHAGGHPAELRPAPALLRRGAGGDRDGRGRALLAHRALATRPTARRPKWACPVSLEDMVRLVQEARRLMPDVGIQVPPNLADWWPELVRAGATDLGGLSANGDHISPEHPFPSPKQVRERLRGIAAPSERLCVYPQYMTSEWLAPRVLDVIRGRATRRSCRARDTGPGVRGRRRSSAPATGMRSRRTSSRRCSPRAAPR